mmetsp:Transcript_39461/g.85895  ORF Transcript_39461/g.85895 Transcript_39461/m.85895 type:complete len:261 (-) Transcript_39461:1065-1847(-)
MRMALTTDPRGHTGPASRLLPRGQPALPACIASLQCALPLRNHSHTTARVAMRHPRPRPFRLAAVSGARALPGARLFSGRASSVPPPGGAAKEVLPPAAGGPSLPGPPHLKSTWTEDSLYTRQMASPRRLATESTVSCGKVFWFSSVTGMVLVTITSSNSPEESRSTAGGLNTAWVAHAITALAPFSLRRRAPPVRVPAVSIMSSIIIAILPSTSPIRFITSASLWACRRLSMMARGASLSFLAKARARPTPPTSGDTTT